MKKVFSIVMIINIFMNMTAFGHIYTIMNINKSFGDLLGFEWAQKEIKMLASKGIVNGTSETTFSPQNKATKADFVSLVCRTLGVMDKFTKSNFNDVQKSKWYYTAVASAEKNGFLETDSLTFEPEKEATRLDVMVILGKVLNKDLGLTIPTNYNDILSKYIDKDKVPEKYKPYVALTINSGLVISKNSLVIGPEMTMNRAEMIIIITNLYNLL